MMPDEIFGVPPERQNMENSGLYEQFYQFVRQIPRGKVVSYGQVAQKVGRGGARDVGFAMAALSGQGNHRDIPWQRVINSRGKCSLEGSAAEIQRRLLQEEGVHFNKNGQVDEVEDWWLDVPF
jgi:methylated-DNA-protein-cysteine methyltransferase-like protein